MTPEDVLNRLEAVRAETLRRFEPLTQAQLDWRPGTVRSDSGEAEWSAGEVFMHLAIDENYLREYLARPLLEGLKPPDSIIFLPPPPPRRAPKDAIAFWFDRARALTRRLLENWPANANLDLRHAGGFDNESNGLEWLMGYGGHEAFHHRQLDALIEQTRQGSVMLQFLYRLEPVRLEMVTVGPTAEEAAIVDRHFAYLESLTQQGVMLLVGRTQDNSPDTLGLVIFQAESEARARSIMENDPTVKNGVMRAKLFPFKIALHGQLPEVA